MDANTPADRHWQTALDWILREHEHEQEQDHGRAPAGLPPAQRAERDAWLAASPEHRAAYAEARRAWLVAGLLPPAG